MQKSTESSGVVFIVAVVAITVLMIGVDYVRTTRVSKPSTAHRDKDLVPMPTQAEIRQRATERLKRTKIQNLREQVVVWGKLGRPIPSTSARTLYRALVVDHIRPKDLEMEQNEAGMLLNAQKELLTGEGSFSR